MNNPAHKQEKVFAISWPPPRSPRYESLTMWRGVACLFVIVYHSIFTGHGLKFESDGGWCANLLGICQRLWIGVPLFFVISGYCVTASADALRRQANPAGQYFWRRFRRIYPPYWVWFAVAALMVFLVDSFIQPGLFGRAYVPSPAALSGWQWFGNLTLTESWRWHITGGVESFLVSPAWTLCYEEQFYAIVGFAMLFARRYFFGALAVVTALVLGGLVLLPRLGIRTEGLFLDGQWLMFASGALVYYTLNYADHRAEIWYSIPIIVGALYAFSEPSLLLRPQVGDPNQSYLAAFLFALLILGLHSWDQVLAHARWLAPFRYCGEMCYSLYLVHWPTVTVLSWSFNLLGVRNPAVVLGVGLPLCVAATVAIARLFHVVIERRFVNASPVLSLPGQASGMTLPS